MSILCRIEDCLNPTHAKTLCGTHYMRLKRHGNPLTIKHRHVLGTPEARFWPKVNKDGPIPSYCPELGHCWIWTAACDSRGYGRFSPDQHSRSSLAHRVLYEWTHGPVLTSDLDHLCRNPSCVNPSHLEPVCHRTNIRRSIGLTSASKTHCVHGHLFTPENTYIRPNGTRTCRICKRHRDRAYKNKNS